MNVSVIIPTYNRPDKLETAIKSIINQTVSPREIIVIDNNSNESVSLEHLSNRIPIVYHRFSKNQGACAARNKGVELSSTEIIMFLDDDDTWEPDKIESQLNVFAKDGDVGLVYTGRIMASESNRQRELYSVKPSQQGYCYPDIFTYNFIGSTSSVAIKKNLFLDVGGFDTNLPAMQDFDLWIRACKKAKVGHDNQTNVRYTIADDPSKQISGNPVKYKKAGLYILNKYSHEINSLNFLTRNKIKSHRYFAIAKTYRKNGLTRTIPWSLKSFLYYPNFKSLILLLPPRLISKVRRATL